ncbi:DUF2057 domain-containing protein [Endozoicomonas sp. SCSIO W0465]|uniref:YccT family protein n=1 Tax=Endozoicomonas sp. SCSIO W0465 TaxID=2918516 RepID=UPI002074F2FE|nr:DUF2057 domain-containing protein [Endozoicomonas sp. SCSIO W0465]USE37058.1 DUF2057 domain-containing protein [Endozoicomonas sp. SCSIO W0465]
MFVRRLLGALLVSTLAMPVIADNTLVLPEKTKLLVLDGKDANELSSKKDLSLGNGRHQLVFQLKTLVREGGDTKMFTTSPYIMTFNLSGDQTYTINAPTLKTARDTNKLSQSPKTQFSITNAKGQTIPFEFSVLNKSGLLIGGDTVEDIQKFNLSDSPAAVREMAGTVYIATPQGISYQVAQQPQPAVMPASATAQPMSESMLQYWYNQADETTRERFLQWISESEKTGK